jgi:hypothetical protein
MSHGPNFIDEPKPVRSINAILKLFLGAALNGFVKVAPPVRVRLALAPRRRLRRYSYKPVPYVAEIYHREFGGPDPLTLPRRLRRMRAPKAYEQHMEHRVERPKRPA